MIDVELNEYTAEDIRLIQELKKMGLDDEAIQKAYNETLRRRREGLPE